MRKIRTGSGLVLSMRALAAAEAERAAAYEAAENGESF